MYDEESTLELIQKVISYAKEGLDYLRSNNEFDSFDLEQEQEFLNEINKGKIIEKMLENAIKKKHEDKK